MSYRKTFNERTQWTHLMSDLENSVEELSSIAKSLATPHAFEGLIQQDDLTLAALNHVEWMHLNAIVDRYSTDWQSWFTAEEFPAIHRQRKSRSWSPHNCLLAHKSCYRFDSRVRV